MRRFLAFIFLLRFFISSNAQQSAFGVYPDIGIADLHNLIAYEKSDTVRVRLLNNLAYTFSVLQNNDSVLFYAQKALDLSIKTHYLKGEFESRKWKPIVLRTEGDYPNALKLAVQNLQIAEQLKDTAVLLLGLHGVARVYTEMNDFTSQLKYNRKSREIINSGFFKSEREIKFNSLVYYLNMMGGAFQELNQFDSALYYLNVTYAWAKDLDSYQPLTIAATNLAKIYLRLNEYDSAGYYNEETMRLVAKMNTRYDLAGEAQLGMAEIFERRNKLDSALQYGRLSIKTFRQLKYPALELKAATFLENIYSKQNRWDSAYKFLALTRRLSDSLNNLQRIKKIENIKYTEALRVQELQQQQREAQQQYVSKMRMYSLIAGMVLISIIAFFLYRNNKHKQKANFLLQQQKQKVETTLSELKATQAQLIQSEKMASLGELTAGIAHEIQNPLNFVNNFSEVNKEMIHEMKEEIDKGNYKEVRLIANNLEENEEKINHHGKRADAIVKGMLQHSRTSSGQKEPTDINVLADEYLRLSYHGLRAKDKSVNADIKTEFDHNIGKINIVSQDIGRVLLNLINNAFYAVSEKQKQNLSGYKPTVTVITKKEKGKAEISVLDNGNGIPKNIVDKIFQPFFTTKPTGQGTGLGLSLAYDIIKAHGGDIRVETKEGEGSEFIVQLPA